MCRNSSVYYELGVVHSLARPVVSLVDRAESLTIDTQNERVIEIGDDGTIGVRAAEAAKAKLRGALDLVLDPTFAPQSVASAVASARSLAGPAPENPIAGVSAKVHAVVNELLRAKGDSEEEESTEGEERDEAGDP